MRVWVEFCREQKIRIVVWFLWWGRGQDIIDGVTIFIWGHDMFHVMSQILRYIPGKESKPEVWKKICRNWLKINDLCRGRKLASLSLPWLGLLLENELLNNNCLVQHGIRDYWHFFYLRSTFLVWSPRGSCFTVFIASMRNVQDVSRLVSQCWH